MTARHAPPTQKTASVVSVKLSRLVLGVMVSTGDKTRRRRPPSHQLAAPPVELSCGFPYRARHSREVLAQKLRIQIPAAFHPFFVLFGRHRSHQA